MLLQNQKVAVIGAGPVGLTAARLLQQEGIDVTVYERDADAHTRIWGGTLDLHRGSGQDALQKAGLLEQYYARALPMGAVMADNQGTVLAIRPSTPETRHDNPEINRNDLRTLLLDSLAEGTVVWNRQLTDLEPQAGRWRLQFETGPEATADFVIVASGGRSRARRWVTDAVPVDTGTFIIQGDVPHPETACPDFYRLCDGNRLMAAHGGTLLVANPYNNGVLTYGVIFKTPDGWAADGGPDFGDPARIQAVLAERFSGWDARYHQLLRATASFWGLPTRRLPLDAPWKAVRPGPITLIGDAAHLMPPFAGQGVNIGLVDAMVLAEALTDGRHGTVQAAIEAYEQQMFGYARDAQGESSANERELWKPDFSFQQFLQ